MRDTFANWLAIGALLLFMSNVLDAVVETYRIEHGACECPTSADVEVEPEPEP